MRQNFFTNTIQSSFIKNVLYNTYLPIWNSISDGDYLIRGNMYVYGSSIVECTNSGFLGTTATIKMINDSFFFGRQYTGLSNRYVSKYTYYSSKDHEKLGEYLRFFRDVWHTNLMPFYNCFSGVYTSRFYIRDKIYEYKYNYYESSKEFSKKYYKNIDNKVLQIPVKFNKKYTIAIDCDSPVSIALAIVNNDELITVQHYSKIIDIQEIIYKYVSGVKSVPNMSFKSPILFETTNQNDTYDMELIGDSITVERFLSLYENNLYLLIQLPQTNSSSVVVLEGDFTAIPEHSIVNGEEIFNCTQADLDKIFISKLSLLQFSDNVRYPFADRLIEFLLLNVITNNETLNNNVHTYQSLFGTLKDRYTLDGVWDDNLRNRVFSTAMDNDKLEKMDLSGYIDKDIEYAYNKKGD